MKINESKNLKKFLPIILNLLIFACAGLGLTLACYFSKADGYYHWLTRLLYFTQQSNLWIGVTSLIFAIVLINGNYTERTLKTISIFKFIFTVSITITGFIFCSVLAPFSEDYNAWSFYSVLSHVVVPVLAIADFFTNENIVKFDKKCLLYTFLPPLIYFIFTSILVVLKFDFGRGETFPYFFMNYYSEVGLFGFVAKWPPDIGSFYWIVFMFGLIYLLSIAYYKLLCVIKDRKNPY